MYFSSYLVIARAKKFDPEKERIESERRREEAKDKKQAKFRNTKNDRPKYQEKDEAPKHEEKKMKYKLKDESRYKEK